MAAINSDALALSRFLLRGLRVLNVIYAACILILLVASLLDATLIYRALGAPPSPETNALALGMQAIVVFGIAGALVAHMFLSHMLAIVDTVRAGDPFIASNAHRLQAVAWWVLAGEVLRLVIGAIADRVSTAAHPLDIHIDFSWTPWLAVVLLFVLARVFDHGTRLRADLEGTV